jgi:transcriptional regulator NrdR family protein
MVKKGNNLSAFQRDKLFVSILQSCLHRTNAITDASWLTDSIVSKLAKKLTDGVIERDKLVTAVYKSLNNFDKSAFVHYQAFHRVSQVTLV